MIEEESDKGIKSDKERYITTNLYEIYRVDSVKTHIKY